jgi:adenylate cyclase
VLPLENLSHDPAEEYFADGMTDALITDLGKIGALRVISRTSVMRYKGTKKNLQEIAKELQVDAIVEGSVTLSGDQVRIGANLVRASPETHLWAESYERDLRDVVSLQSDLAQAIAREVQVKLTAQERSRLATSRPVNPEAYQLYLKSRYYWNKRTQEGFTKAVEYFQRAIEIDPGYAVAYADLGAVYKQFAYYGIDSPQKSYLLSAEPAKKALQLDDSLAEAHTVMATLEEEHERDWSAAENEYKRGIELNPNYATAHHWYALFLLRMGRLDESKAELERAVQLDPGSLIINKTAGDPDYFARRYDQAMKQYRKTLEMDPNFYVARLFLGYGYEQKGQLTEAIAEFQRARQSDNDPAVLGALGHAYAMSGQTRETHALLDELKRSKRYVSPYHIAIIHVGLEENDQAFQWLDKAYQDGGPWLLYLKVDPRLDRLRSDSRYTGLLQRLRLPP